MVFIQKFMPWEVFTFIIGVGMAVSIVCFLFTLYIDWRKRRDDTK